MSQVTAMRRQQGLGMELGMKPTLEKVMAIGEGTYGKAS